MRTLVFIFGLFCAIGARGQGYLNSYAFGAAPAAGLLLDSFPGAEAAWSVRRIDKDYTGSLLEIRRASDNATTTIGYMLNNDLDTAAINTHCSGTTCTVRTWYDQSGNGNHLVQTTAANQPIIYESGAIVREGGLPSVRWDGTDARLNRTISALNNAAALCVFITYSSAAAAAANTNTAVLWQLGDIFVSSNMLIHFSSTGFLSGEFMAYDVRRSINGAERMGSSTYRRNANTLSVESTFFLTSGTTFQQNGSSVTLDLTVVANTTTNLTPANGNITGSFWLGVLFASPSTYTSANQKISECIVYPTDQSANRSAITTNILNYF